MMTSNEQADRTGRLSVQHRVADGVRVVSLTGEIDHTTKDVVRDALQAREETSRVVADLEHVTFLDSSGINVLIYVNQHLSDVGGWLRVAAATPSVNRVIELVGIDAVIPCHRSVEEALNS
ncbi:MULTISPECIES: STAS domain-containing protein [Streptomyces]|uniref:STAS domain-containing protein n=1 Tax=unclassified Streptomyces TaxID=2593676 RepID=UPI0029059B79|nr:STAS domain-containing protein [Streptomyces sp. adm13(2018)]